MVICVCSTCGAKFNVKPSAIANGRGKFCSRGCRYSNPTYKNESWLRHQYIDLNKPIKEIYIEAGISERTFNRWLHAFNIPQRSTDVPEYCKNEVWLKKQYIDLKKSMHEISADVGVSSSSIRDLMLENNIPRKTRSEALKGMPRSPGHCAKISQAHKGKQLTQETRTKLSISHRGLKRTPEVRKRISISKLGNKNPSWAGGISFWPYCDKFNRALKNKVRDEFQHKCFLCSSSRGRTLHVHHVDYNKSQGCSGHPWGLIPLCVSCHAKTNTKRWHWFALLRDYWVYAHIDFSSNMSLI